MFSTSDPNLINFNAFREPMPQLPERGGGSGHDTRLSLENDAIALPKVLCFTVYCSAPSPRLRAPASYKRQSWTGVQILGEARGTILGMPKCTVIYVTFVIVCLTSPIVVGKNRQKHHA